jgi:hypothetical protein
MSSYIGNSPQFGLFRKLDALTFNGSTTTFTLTSGGANVVAGDVTQLFVSLNGVIQEPGIAFTLTSGGGQIVFSTAPTSGMSFFGVLLGNTGAPTVNDGQITAAKLSSTAITDKLGYTPANESTVNAQITSALVNPVFTGNGITIPSGTTAQRPASPSVGLTRFNTTTGSIEFYDGTNWISTNLIPTINSVTGTIFAGVASNLTLSVSNATDIITVRFSEGEITLADVIDVAVSSGSATVAVPSAVFNQTGGDIISVSIINQDGTPSSNAVTRTVAALPTGGTITTSGSFRIHTFTTSSNFVVPSGFSATAQYLIVAGGGGGGSRHAGGGGAGGYIDATASLSAQTYSVVVGAGGNGGIADVQRGANGSNSSAFGNTAIGGGGGGQFTEGNTNQNFISGANGGSGGGASNGATVTANGVSGAGTSGQGNSGGNITGGGAPWAAAGGGGANAAGSNNVNNDVGGAGGAGRQWLNSSFYAGGGGGGGGTSGTAGAGGSGGGGAGAIGIATATNGVTNTGGGGGGSRGGQGGAGGSGIVIIRYQL